MASNKDKDKGRLGEDRSSGSKRGFASMDEDRRREIASKGGKAAHEKGTAHEFDSEEAREAGRAAHEKGTAHEFDSEEAREAGRKGGKSRGKGGPHDADSSSSSGGGASEQAFQRPRQEL